MLGRSSTALDDVCEKHFFPRLQLGGYLRGNSHTQCRLVKMQGKGPE